MIQTVGIELAQLDASSLQEQLIATGIILLVLVGIGYSARYFRARDPSRFRGVDIAIGLLLVVIACIATLALITVWGGLPIVLAFFDTIQLENPVIAVVQIGFTLVVLVGTYLLTGVVKRVIHELLEDQGSISQHQTEVTYRTTQVGMLLLAVIVILGIWDVDLSGVLVGAGFLGIVLGLAARQTLGSLIAGFVLMFSRPFEIGDWVQIGDREGIVTEISIVNTRIQTFDGEYAMIPNDTVGAQEIINRTRKGRLRIHVPVGVDYATDLKAAAEIAETVMADVDDVLSVPQPHVIVTGFGDSAIMLDLRYWIDKPSIRRQNRSRTAVIQAVKTAFDEAGIKIPFPQRELMGRIEEGGFQVAGNERTRPAEHTEHDAR